MGSFKGPLPENIRKAMAPDVRRKIGQPTNQEATATFCRKQEAILHQQFIQWCNLNRILFKHDRMDRKTTSAKGWPDFILFGPGGKVCMIEFKVVGNKLTIEQDNLINELLKFGHDVLVAYNLESAIAFARGRLAI